MNMHIDVHKWMDEWVDRWIGRHIMARRHFEQPNKHESTGSLFSLFFFQFVGFSAYTPLKKTYYKNPIVVVTYTPVYPMIPMISSRSRSLVDGAPRGAPSEYLRWRPGRRSRIPVAGEDTKSLGTGTTCCAFVDLSAIEGYRRYRGLYDVNIYIYG